MRTSHGLLRAYICAFTVYGLYGIVYLVWVTDFRPHFRGPTATASGPRGPEPHDTVCSARAAGAGAGALPLDHARGPVPPPYPLAVAQHFFSSATVWSLPPSEAT